MEKQLLTLLGSPAALAFVTAAGAAIVWLISRLQTLVSIRKEQTETFGLRAEQMNQWFAAEALSKEAMRKLETQMLAFNQALLRQQAEDCTRLREDLLNTFVYEFVSAFYRVYGLGRWIFQGKEMELIDDELLPFLEISAELVATINAPDVLKLCALRPFEVSHYDFLSILRYIRRQTWFWDARRRVLQGHCVRIGISEQG